MSHCLLHTGDLFSRTTIVWLTALSSIPEHTMLMIKLFQLDLNLLCAGRLKRDKLPQLVMPILDNGRTKNAN